MIAGTLQGKESLTRLSTICQYKAEKKINRTAVIQLFLSFSGVLMEVQFHKKVRMNSFLHDIRSTIDSTPPTKLDKVLKQAVKKGLEGDVRTVRGYHTQGMNEFGRVQFHDLEKGGIIQVDPRSITYIIIHNIKYTVK